MANYAAHLPITMTELIGPKTNSRTVAVLHPDMHQGTESGHMDAGRARISQREGDRCAWLPSKHLANLYLKNYRDWNQVARDGKDAQGNVDPAKLVLAPVTQWDELVYLDDTYVAGQEVLLKDPA